ncbi:MAG: hypothetical protein HPY89_04395 [Pelotomaculum sp.]|nr:hypothetical protein [Pelotomaculum sp.]
MELVRLWEILNKRLSVILVTVILAVVTSGVTCMLLPVQYRARAFLRLDQTDPATGLSRPDYNSLMMYRQLARTYSELAASEPVMQKLSGAVNGELSPEKLKEMVSVRKVKDLELLEISVVDENPERAAYLADRLAAILQQEERNAWKMNNLQVIVPAFPDRRPAGPNVFLAVFTAGLAGLGLAVMAVAVLEYPAGKGQSWPG